MYLNHDEMQLLRHFIVGLKKIPVDKVNSVFVHTYFQEGKDESGDYLENCGIEINVNE